LLDSLLQEMNNKVSLPDSDEVIKILLGLQTQKKEAVETETDVKYIPNDEGRIILVHKQENKKKFRIKVAVQSRKSGQICNKSKKIRKLIFPRKKIA